MKKTYLIILLVLAVSTLGFAENNRFDLTIKGGTELAFTPTVDIDGEDEVPFKPGAKGELEFSYNLPQAPFLDLYINSGYGMLPTKDSNGVEIDTFHKVEWVGGVAFRVPMGEKFIFRLFADAGYYIAFWEGDSGGDFMASGGISGAFQFHPKFSVNLSPRYRVYTHDDPGVIHSLDIMMGLTWHIDGK